MSGYKGIIFPKGYNRPFEEFKEQYASNYIFKEIPHTKREAELKKAHKIATNGNLSTGTKKRKKANASKNKD